MKRNTLGYTLIELMVVVAIVGILASIAIPAYTEHVNKSRRIDGQTALIGLAQAMEGYYTENSTYVGAAVGATGIFPSQAPLDNDGKLYNLEITAQTATGFTVQATPINGQVGDGNLTLSNTGARTWDGNSGWY